jgi:hypothetical protein
MSVGTKALTKIAKDILLASTDLHDTDSFNIIPRLASSGSCFEDADWSSACIFRRLKIRAVFSHQQAFAPHQTMAKGLVVISFS